MKAKRIVVAGSSGLVGSRLVPYLEASGYEVVRLVRRPVQDARERSWDPANGSVEPGALDGAFAIVNLAGISIAAKRWNESRKREILQSRLDATELLARMIGEQREPPTVFISTSATGYYGDGGKRMLTEHSPKGNGFLAEVCDQWEAATFPAVQAGIRVVHPRFGIVLAPEGGMLAQLKRLFGLGLGGRIGGGDQFMSWVDIDDTVRAVDFLLTASDLIGPVNVVSPSPVTNRVFTDSLGSTLGRPAVMPAPGFAIRAMMGQMADELVLVSQRVIPERLCGGGFQFQSPTLESSLQRQIQGVSTAANSSSPARAA